MAWIESHQALLNHRKTNRALTLLRVDRHLLIGHLHALWWWAIDNVADEDGDLGDLTDEEIAMGAGWSVRLAAPFVAALTEAGFIDQAGNKRSLHDWYTYAGKLAERRNANKARQQKHRNVVRNAEVTVTSPVSHIATQHNLHDERVTQHNTTEPPPAPPTLPGKTDVGILDNAARASPEKPVLSRDEGLNVFELYEQTFGQLVPNDIIRQRLEDAEQENGYECVRHCLEETARADVNDWRYTDAILNRHLKEGCYVNQDGRLHVKRGPPATEWDAGRGERYLVGKAQALADRTPEEMAAIEAKAAEISELAERLQEEGAAEREAAEAAQAAPK